MRKIQLNAAKLHLNKEKITSLDIKQTGKIVGGDINSATGCSLRCVPQTNQYANCGQDTLACASDPGGNTRCH